jgi:uncharacterized phage-associated protein
MTTAAMTLAHHVLVYTCGADHLKLQKLCFYAYGAALAFDLDHEIGEVVFEPWKHGPVNREVWDAFKVHKAERIAPPAHATVLSVSPELTGVLSDALDVYGLMSSWSIRCESHLEEPWLRARAAARPMEAAELRKHFKQKFAAGRVAMPSYLAGAASSALDGIPSARFASLRSMAEALRARRRDLAKQ